MVWIARILFSSTLGATKYILKVEESDYPELPAMEFVCNQIFDSLNIQVPPFYLILFESEHTSFVTENFMGSLYESSLVHLYHFFTEKLDYNCENSLRIIGEYTGRITAQEDVIFVTLADSLIGNNDRHGRNLGFIQTSKGYTLSPFYDNVSYLGIESASLLEADHQPKGAIKTLSTAEPTMSDYVREWNRLGFGYVIDRFRKALSLNQIDALIERSHLTKKRKKAFLKIIKKRSGELCQ